jgi:N-carbamoylputrescine amidase
MGRLRVTVVEIDSESGGTERWLSDLSGHLRRAESDVVVLPELPFSTWFMAAREVEADVWERSIAEHRAGIARLRSLGVPPTILSIPRNGERKRHHDSILLEGAETRRLHTKAYLPDEPGAYEASWYCADGAEFGVHAACGTRLGVMMCSDLWYPEHARSMGRAGAAVIVAPRATLPSTHDRWVAAIRVNAIVSGAYVASSNRAGKQGEVAFGGAGIIAHPDGRVLATTSPDCPFITLDLDLDATARARADYPCNIVEPGGSHPPDEP